MHNTLLQNQVNTVLWLQNWHSSWDVQCFVHAMHATSALLVSTPLLTTTAVIPSTVRLSHSLDTLFCFLQFTFREHLHNVCTT